MKLKAVKEEKKKFTGKEGAETVYHEKELKDSKYMDAASFTEAELDKYLRIQKEYLEFLINLGFPIPKDKNELFKILIMKDYYSTDELKKRKQYQIQRLESEGKQLESKL